MKEFAIENLDLEDQKMLDELLALGDEVIFVNDAGAGMAKFIPLPAQTIP